MPELEPTPQEGKNEEASSQSKGGGKQSRSEKKSRKAVTRLGLKPVSGFFRVIVKKSKSVLFIIPNPDVFKSPSNDSTWVIFGEAKLEDNANNALQKTAEQFAATENKTDEEQIPDLVNNEETASTEKKEEEGDVQTSKLINLVMDQVTCTRAQAAAALKRTNNDVVNAIMELSVGL